MLTLHSQIVQPAFNHSHLVEMIPIFEKKASSLTQKWKQFIGKEIDVVNEMSQLTLVLPSSSSVDLEC
jgi:cytochrome P450